MGYRTVVMLNNDHANEWANDPELGQKKLHVLPERILRKFLI